MAHWNNHILGNPEVTNRTVLVGDVVAGNIGAWTDLECQERLICYWLGREFWGQGIASRALQQFLEIETTRPLTARVAKHNFGSIRVLEKGGFARIGEDAYAPPGGVLAEEWIYRLSK